jgi:hypothetical protein
MDDDSDFTLVDALKKGRLAAIRDGAELPREYWFGKAPRDLGPNVYFRREDVLAVWPPIKDLRSALEATYEASTGRWLDSRVEANAIVGPSYHGRIEGSKADAANAPAGCDATTPSNAISAHIRNLTRRNAPVRLSEVIGAINPIIRGWGNYYRKANVRKLFHQLDGWIERRLWSFIAKRWRNVAYRKYPTRRLVTEMGLIRLISLVPGITMLLTPARRPYRKAACGKTARAV